MKQLELNHAGWLELQHNDPVNSSIWKRLWFVLSTGSLRSFSDETCEHCTGEVQITSNARSRSFADAEAMPSMQRLLEDHPHGFCLEPDSSAGDLRQVIFLDALSSPSLETWLEALKVLASDVRSDGSGTTQSVPTRPASISGKSPDRGRSGFPVAADVSPTYDIDDFSDYEDDRNARSSSLDALERYDWTSPPSSLLPCTAPEQEEHEYW